MRMHRFASIVAMLAFVSVTTAETAFVMRAAEPTGPAPAVVLPDEWRPLHESWAAAMEELKIPGMAVCVVKGDQILLLDALGVCDPEGKRPVRVDSPFYIASSTKSFTAMAILLLVEEGKIDLDAPVRTYLPRFEIADRKLSETVTVRDLLCHRYGLDSIAITFAEAYSGTITEELFYRSLPKAAARGKFSYSNLHYTLAGRIIEAVTGMSWKDFLAKRLFEPLGMESSTCYASRLFADPHAAFPIIEQDGAWALCPVRKTDNTMHAAGGMAASATDLANWLKFQLGDGTFGGHRVISEELLNAAHTQQVTDPQGTEGPGGFRDAGYTLGWFCGDYRGRRIVQHGGGYIGARAFVSFMPDENIAVAAVANEAAPNPIFVEMVAADAYDKLLGEKPRDDMPQAREIAKRTRERAKARTPVSFEPLKTGAGLSLAAEDYAGQYQNDAFGTVIVELKDGQLQARLGDLKIHWGAATDVDRFRAQVSSENVVAGKFEIQDGHVMSMFLPVSGVPTRFTKR